MQVRLRRLKYSGRAGWAEIFGRLIISWLDHNIDPADYDLITINPTHPTRKPLRHTELILAAAIDEDWLDEWPFDRDDPTALCKIHQTDQSAGLKWHGKRAAAEQLYNALEVTRPWDIKDAKVLVIDDMTTTLFQMRACAHALLSAGASLVDGLVICRQLPK